MFTTKIPKLLTTLSFSKLLAFAVSAYVLTLFVDLPFISVIISIILVLLTCFFFYEVIIPPILESIQISDLYLQFNFLEAESIKITKNDIRVGKILVNFYKNEGHTYKSYRLLLFTNDYSTTIKLQKKNISEILHLLYRYQWIDEIYIQQSKSIVEDELHVKDKNN